MNVSDKWACGNPRCLHRSSKAWHFEQVRRLEDTIGSRTAEDFEREHPDPDMDPGAGDAQECETCGHPQHDGMQFVMRGECDGCADCANIGSSAVRDAARAVLDQFDYWAGEPRPAVGGGTVRIHRFAEVQPEMERALTVLRKALRG